MWLCGRATGVARACGLAAGRAVLAALSALGVGGLRRWSGRWSAGQVGRLPSRVMSAWRDGRCSAMVARRAHGEGRVRRGGRRRVRRASYHAPACAKGKFPSCGRLAASCVTVDAESPRPNFCAMGFQNDLCRACKQKRRLTSPRPLHVLPDLRGSGSLRRISQPNNGCAHACTPEVSS